MKQISLSAIFFSAIGAVTTIYFGKKYYARRMQNMQWEINKRQDHFWLLNHWLELKNEGKSLVSYFEDLEYHHIAIYGMAELANRLSEELENSQISIDYGIDWNVCSSIARIDDVYSPDDMLPETEVIVVTPYAMFDEIKETLNKKVKCPIISIEDVVWSV